MQDEAYPGRYKLAAERPSRPAGAVGAVRAAYLCIGVAPLPLADRDLGHVGKHGNAGL